MTPAEVLVLPDPAALAQTAAERFVAIAKMAIATHGRFDVVLAGGSTPVGLYGVLAQEGFRSRVAWEQTFVYFGDERCVPPNHPDSNYRMAHEALLSKVPLSAASVFRMLGEKPPDEGATAYETILRQNFGLRGRAHPHFDLILLGMGADGHTASLFSGMPALAETRRLVVPTAAPPHVKPQARRLTLTLPILNAARHVMFLVASAAKATTVKAVLAGSEPVDSLPARRVKPHGGKLIWFLDQAAAKLLN